MIVEKIVKSELIENKSKFISIIFPLQEQEEYKQIIKQLKKDYKDAKHICFAMRFKSYTKCDDDGEPNRISHKSG